MKHVKELQARMAEYGAGGKDRDLSNQEFGCRSVSEDWAEELATAIAEDEPKARPLSEWHEDHGSVVWWKFPIEEAGWIGTPSDSEWPGYHTHWTPHPESPEEPQT